MRLKSLLMAGCTLVLPVLATSAFAQGAPQGGIEEVVVTATRHAQNIMTVPAAIQAQTIQQLSNRGIRNLTDVELVTPGYAVSDSSGYTQIFIRGIGNNIFVGADPSVATYVDDVPRPWGQFVNQFVDVSRVEVLKGAQGGLYGRNATGGVVNVITEQPSTDEYYGHGFLRFGEYTTIDAGAFMNVPLSDEWAISFAAEHESHSPYIRNIANPAPYSAANFPANNLAVGIPGTLFGAVNPLAGAKFCGATGGTFCTPQESANLLNSGLHVQGEANQNTEGYDTKLLWQPASNFKATLAGDYYFKDDANGNQNVDITPGIADGYLRSQNPVLGASPAYIYGSAGTGFGSLAPVVLPAPLSGNPLGAADLGTLPLEQGTFKKWQVAVGDQPLQELHEWGSSLIPVWNTPWADVTSITAYRANHSLLYASLCACSIPQGTAIVDIHRQYYYQEFRAVSNTEGPFHWLAGATFLNDHFTSDTRVNILYPLISLHTAHAYDLVQNWTVYGQLGYDFWDNFNLTASLRWEHESNWARFPSIPPVQVAGQAQEGLYKLIPSANLNYKLDDGTAFIRWARGVKSGGVNPVASPGIFEVVGAPLSDGSVFGPEKVDTYEAGYKQSLLDHTLQLTGDIFYNKYNGLQESAHATAAFQSTVILAIVNAGSARTYGAEGTALWQATDSLQVGANVGYLDARYSTFSYGFNGPVLFPTNLSHTQMPSAPKWQLSFTADYDQPLDDRFNLVGNIIESHLSTQLFDQSVLPPGGKLYGYSVPNAVGPGYWITNLKFGVKTNDDVYKLQVFAQNLFDQKYYTFGSSEASSGTLLSWGNPRVVGVEFDANW